VFLLILGMYGLRHIPRNIGIVLLKSVGPMEENSVVDLLIWMNI
jgi:hypothetical protein